MDDTRMPRNRRKTGDLNLRRQVLDKNYNNFNEIQEAHVSTPQRLARKALPKLKRKASRAENLVARLDSLYEEEFTGRWAFFTHFFISTIFGLLYQSIFSSPWMIKQKCVNDSTISYENGVACGSIFAYIYLGATYDAVVLRSMFDYLYYCYNNAMAIVAEILKIYGVVAFFCIIERAILIPYIFSNGSTWLWIFLPFFCSCAGQANYILAKISELCFQNTDDENNMSKGTKEVYGIWHKFKFLIYIGCLISGFIFLSIFVTSDKPVDVVNNIITFDKLPIKLHVHPSPRFSSIIFGNGCIKHSKKKRNRKRKKKDKDEAEDEEDDFLFIPEKRRDSLEVLGLPPKNPNTPFKDIKIAFKKLALEYHPDKCKIVPKEECTNQFIQVQQAYEYLERWEERRKETEEELSRLKNK